MTFADGRLPLPIGEAYLVTELSHWLRLENQRPQFKHIGYRFSVLRRFVLISQIAADMTNTRYPYPISR